jgi:hypothetical protein
MVPTARPGVLSPPYRRVSFHVMQIPPEPAPPASRDPLHGITLEQMLNDLVAHFGWPGLGERVALRCFTSDPSVASSLKFLRKTP